MINHPGYFPTTGGAFEDTVQGSLGLAPAGMSPEGRYDPKLAEQQKAEALKAHRAFEIMNIAQQLENIRQRLVSLDIRALDEPLSDIVSGLIHRWDDERRP